MLADKRKRETPAIPYMHIRRMHRVVVSFAVAFVKFATAFVKHSLAFIHVYMPFVKLICEDLKHFERILKSDYL